MTDTEYALNEAQALFVAIVSNGDDGARTPKTEEITRLVVDVFLAWYRQEMGADNLRDATMRQRAREVYGPIAKLFSDKEPAKE